MESGELCQMNLRLLWSSEKYMNKKQKGLLRIILIIVLVALVGAVGYYFIYYRPNKNELIKISKEFIENSSYMLVIPEEIREEEYRSEKVQAFVDETREELSKYYSRSGDYLENEMNDLIEYYESKFIDGDEMIIDMESEVYQIDEVRFSTKAATVKLRIKNREYKGIYGPHTVKSRYTIEYVKENGEWRVVSKEYEPIVE